MTSPGLVYHEGAQCDLKADLAVVPTALEHLKTYLADRAFPPEDFDPLLLALAEALNNGILHGARDRPDATLRLRWFWTEHRLELHVRDPGHFTPPADWAELPEDPFAESGRGGFIISSYFDEVEHLNSDQGHELILRKHTSRPAAAPNTSAIEEELQLMTQDLSDSYESLAALFNISGLLATSATFAEFLGSVLKRLRQLIEADLVYTRVRHASRGWSLSMDRSSRDVQVPTKEMGALEQSVWDSQRLRSIDNGDNLPATEALRHWQAGVIVCPIGFHGEPIGLVTTGRRGRAPFTAGQTSLVRTVADFVGVAFATDRLRRQREEQLREMRDLEIAAQIQRSLLPTNFPANANWTIHGACESAQAVGGDFFDTIESPDGHVLVLVADVMGKGVPAAMFAALLRASVRARIDLAANPGALLTELNRLLGDDLASLSLFITAIAASLPPDGGDITLACAGHPPPFCFRPGSSPAKQSELTAANVPLGILSNTVYENDHVHLGLGEVAVFGTDGLYEFENARNELYTAELLADELPRWWTGDPLSYCSAVLTHLSLLERGRQADDRTMVVVHRPTPTP